MTSTLLIEAARLRQTFRRQRFLTIVEGLALVGMLPLCLSVPRADGARTLAVVVLAVYAALKAVQFDRSHRSVKQLRLEEHFLRFAHDAAHLRRCLRWRHHLWDRSHIVQTLQLMALSKPGVLRPEVLQRRVHHQYERAFRAHHPPRLVMESLLFAGLMLALFVPSRVAFSFEHVLFQAGSLALVLLAGASLTHWILLYRARGHFSRFLALLAAWTLEEPLGSLMPEAEGRDYAHTVLYRAAAWTTAAGDGVPESGSALPDPPLR